MTPERSMKVKGTGPTALNAFVKTKFPDRFNEWLSAMPPESKKIHEGIILTIELYSLYDALVTPTQKVCDLFYEGDEKGAWETGIHSASLALNRFYKIFFKFGSPHFIIERASRVFSNYYPEGGLRVKDSSSSRCILQVFEFPEPYRLIELSIAGWVDGALELMGQKERNIDITQWMSQGDPVTEIIATWKQGK